MKKVLCGATIALASLTAAIITPVTSLAQAGDWLVRARGIYVVPDESSTVTAIGGAVDIDNELMPELDFTYFFTNNIATELILATTRHSATVVGSTLGDLELGRVSLLPPTLLLQYHFDGYSDLKPYMGAGVNWTIFYDADLPAATVTDIDYTNSFGFALQAGFDVNISNDIFLNVDVKKLFLNTDVTINGGAINADVDVNPWIFGIGFGKSF